jgi:hypothetical protein
LFVKGKDAHKDEEEYTSLFSPFVPSLTDELFLQESGLERILLEENEGKNGEDERTNCDNEISSLFLKKIERMK